MTLVFYTSKKVLIGHLLGKITTAELSNCLHEQPDEINTEKVEIEVPTNKEN